MREQKGARSRAGLQSLSLKKWPFPVKHLVHDLSVPVKRRVSH
jgi:hypothetical protein